jgi:hypothetical protein
MDKIFVVYSDESGIFNCRYQTIALVSGQEIILSQLRGNLKDILDKHKIDEVKFTEIGNYSPKVEAPREFIQCVVKGFASQAQAKVRIDVLTWDTQDSRHAIQGRNDIANLERMYYKVLIYAARQWNQTDWNFYPDENSQVHWNEIAEFLNSTRLSHSKPSLLTLFESEGANQLFQFRSVKPMDSLQEPLIQLADLFAGMARFTREEGEQCVRWLDFQENKNHLQLSFLPHAEDELDEPTKAKQNRFQLTEKFDGFCKQYTLGVSLREKKYLWTPDPTRPINFWNYEPQHERDKAPTR